MLSYPLILNSFHLVSLDPLCFSAINVVPGKLKASQRMMRTVSSVTCSHWNTAHEATDTPPRVKFHDRVRRIYASFFAPTDFLCQVDAISRFLSPGAPPPSMDFDRTDGQDALTLPTPKTRLYIRFPRALSANLPVGLLGFDGVILEATQAAQVVSVTLF